MEFSVFAGEFWLEFELEFTLEFAEFAAAFLLKFKLEFELEFAEFLLEFELEFAFCVEFVAEFAAFAKFGTTAPNPKTAAAAVNLAEFARKSRREFLAEFTLNSAFDCEFFILPP